MAAFVPELLPFVSLLAVLAFAGGQRRGHSGSPPKVPGKVPGLFREPERSKVVAMVRALLPDLVP